MKMNVTTQILKLREMLISAPPLPLNAFILAQNIARQNNMFVNVVMNRPGNIQFGATLIPQFGGTLIQTVPIGIRR